jgi:glycosyltransferase involved in cell wall biosynthesis
MNISIGILAYNEAALISKMLYSLIKQSLFQESYQNWNIEIIIVPNGCTDDTATMAQKTLDKLKLKTTATNISYQVCELKQAGKSNAWNVFVHQLSNPEADYIFVMDADIELIERHTLSSMVKVLQTMPEAQVSVDRPIKDVLFKEKKNLMEQLSASISSLSGNKAVENGAAWICGQLYCAKAEILRRIWLPTNLLNEDGFLYSAIVTDLWRLPPNPKRVILARQASHAFKAYTNLYSLLRHEKGQICGNAVNELIYEDLLKNKNYQENIGKLIKQRNEQNYMWLNELIQAKIAEKGWWVIPKFILMRRFLSLKDKPIGKLIILFPLALAAFCVDLLLSVQANLELHQGKGLVYWGK